MSVEPQSQVIVGVGFRFAVVGAVIWSILVVVLAIAETLGSALRAFV